VTALEGRRIRTVRVSVIEGLATVDVTD